MLSATFLWSWLSPLTPKSARSVLALKTEKELAHAK
jgi:hypothetical protein